MAGAVVIDGKARAASLRAQVAEAVPGFVAAAGRPPGLAVVLVGDDPASRVYVGAKGRATEAAGMHGAEHRLPADTAQADLLALVDALNRDPAIDGILVQLPLPRHIDEAAVIAAIDPDKDVDGFHVVNAGRLAVGMPGLVPCTPYGCALLIADTVGDLRGKHAVVVGRSNIVGKPMAALLLAAHATVTIAHRHTPDVAAFTRMADVLVVAVGVAGLVRGDWIKPGACVIDVGINRVDDGNGGSRLVGDVAWDEALAVAGAITPVPGGVGPMTIAVLMRNTLVAAHLRAGLSVPAI